ncbi:MAG TPA: YkgJ family cysteine cluster protein [Dehalococcoidia bacterium]|nr:YkgJ family cysteine cluster protein [Dehalococcoidia bacterium]
MEDKQFDRNQPDDLRQQIAEGLLYAHSRANSNTTRTLEAASFLYALIELMGEKGLITIEELDQRKRVVGERLAQQFHETGMGAMFQDPEYEKYSFDGGMEIDCESRIPLCKATYCRLPFALSRQDVREGIVRWNLGKPYLIDQGDDGYCAHLDRCGRGCTIYENRPVPCRAFDCRNDRRIWLDFEKRVPNPDINQPDWPYCLQEKDSEDSDA